MQRVTVHGSTSANLPVRSGVPPGSILGPLLFSLYVNDLPHAVTFSHVAMIADDTKLFKDIKQSKTVHSSKSPRPPTNMV